MNDMQAVCVRYITEHQTVVYIPKGGDIEGRREAMLDALDAIEIPENKDNEYLSDTFVVQEFTDPDTDRTVCRELKLIGTPSFKLSR